MTLSCSNQHIKGIAFMARVFLLCLCTLIVQSIKLEPHKVNKAKLMLAAAQWRFLCLGHKRGQVRATQCAVARKHACKKVRNAALLGPPRESGVRARMPE